MIRLTLLCLTALYLSGCATQPMKTEPAPKEAIVSKGFLPPPKSQEQFTVVKTFYATDRNNTGSSSPEDMFGGDRAELSYGEANITIPKGHVPGEIESPSIWKLEFSEDPAKHVTVSSLKPLEKATFFQTLQASVGDGKGSNAFVFVHGYNVSFISAAKRTAQIAYDLKFNGAPVFYSWPSQASTSGYTVDEVNIQWAEANIKNFLSDFFDQSGADNIYLVAHSMGNRGLTRALATLIREKPEINNRLREIILAAPDIDAEVFRRDIAPALAKAGKPITLYASSEDLALAASKQVHKHPRAGDAGESLVLVKGVETIDATGVDTSLLGHSYFAETSPVLADLLGIIRKGLRAKERSGLKPVSSAKGDYWIFNE